MLPSPPPFQGIPSLLLQTQTRPRASGSEVGIRGWSSSQILREELSKVEATEGDPQICLNALQILRLLNGVRTCRALRRPGRQEAPRRENNTWLCVF